DFGQRIALTDEGIVIGYRAVRIDADDRSDMRIKILRPVAELRRGAVAHGDEQMPLIVENQPRAEMRPALDLRLLAEDDLDIFERRQFLVQPTASNRRTVAAAAGLGEAEIDQPAFFELRIERDVQKAALTLSVDLRYAANGLGDGPVFADVPEIAGAFRDQHAFAIRQKRDRPGVTQPIGNSRDADR